MKTTEYLDAIKARAQLRSDSQLANALGITTASMHALRHGHARMQEATAAKAAQILGIPAQAIIADGLAEKCKDPTLARGWEQIADQLRDPKSPLAKQLFALC